jgi:type I restriction enzyme, S subunit
MSDWKTYRIGEIAEIFDGPHATPTKTSDGPWFLSIASLKDGRLDLSESAHVSEDDFLRWTRRVMPRPGDLLFSYETRLGEAALMPERLRACLGRRMALIRPRAEIVDPRFLLYAYLGPEFQEMVRRRTVHGATVDRIPLVDFPSWPIKVPDLAHQRMIGALLGALDDKIVVNERIADTAFELGSLCYERSWINASRIREFTIGDVADIFDGPHATPKKISDGPWFLSISSLKKGRLDLSESAHISEESFRRWTHRVTPREGDLLFSYETRLGEAALMQPGIRGCLGRRMALMRPRQGRVDSIFLLYSYLRKEFQETIRRRAIHGATVDRIPLAELPSWRIRILDSDQHRPLAKLLGALHNKMVLSQRENDTLRELRGAVLPKLLSGELRVRDAQKFATVTV